MRKRLHFLRLVLWFAPAVILVAQTEHKTAFTGTWKLNKAESNLPPDYELQSETLRMTEDGRVTVASLSNKGERSEWSYPWSDGKEVPVEGIKNATVTQTIQDHTSDLALKVAGKTVTTIHIVLAADGKTHKDTVTEIDSKGHSISHVKVFDKQ